MTKISPETQIALFKVTLIAPGILCHRANPMKFLYADIILCHSVFGIIKISIVLFYKRIFDVAWFRKLANGAILIIGS